MYFCCCGGAAFFIIGTIALIITLSESGFFALVGSIILTLICFFFLLTALVSFFIFIFDIFYYEDCTIPLIIFIISLSIGLYIGFAKDVFYDVGHAISEKIEYDKKIREYNKTVHYYAFYNFNTQEDIVEIQYKKNNQTTWEKRKLQIPKRSNRYDEASFLKIELPRDLTEIRIKTTSRNKNYYVYLSGNINHSFKVKASGEEYPRIVIGYFDKKFCQIDVSYKLEKKSLLDWDGGGGLNKYNLRAYEPYKLKDSKKEAL